MGLFNAPLSI